MIFAPLLKYVAGGLAALALLLGIALKMERAHSAKQQVQIERLNDRLRSISAARDEQGKTTVRTIERAKVVYRDADTRAKVVEAAPLAPGQCRTPTEIMDSDI